MEIDKKAALQNNSLPMGTFKKNVSLSSVDFRGLFQHKPEEVRDVFGRVVRVLWRHVVVPIKPVSIYITNFSDSLGSTKAPGR